jgi:predicted O-methyltransferase YrrM
MTDAYRSFFNNFESGYRSKHISLHWANPALRVLGREHKREVRAVQRNNRPYHLPWRGPLPQEFIRLDPWEGQYIFLISSMAKRGILEIGRFNGGSLLMACANPAVPVYSIDIAPQDDAYLREIFRFQGLGGNAKLIDGDSQRERSRWRGV